MRCDLLPISDLAPRDLIAWEQLGGDALVPNPFAEPAFVLPAARAWDVTDLRLLVVRNGSDWLAAIPVRQVQSWRNVPGKALAGWRHAYCYLGTPLVVSTDAEKILATLIRKGVEAYGSFTLDWIDADGPLADPLTSALAGESRAVVLEVFERAALHRRERPDYLERALSSRHRREYSRKWKQLEREVGSLKVHDESEDPQARTRFLELERSGWKGAAGTAMACNPAHASFFTDMCQGFATSGRFRMLSLSADGRTVAMRNELLAGDTTFTFKIAFAETFARYSPGIQLEIAALDHFHASGSACSDSCTAPENATLNRLWPERRVLRSVVATRRNASGVAAYAKWIAAAKALPLRRKLTPSPTGVRGH